MTRSRSGLNSLPIATLLKLSEGEELKDAEDSDRFGRFTTESRVEDESDVAFRVQKLMVMRGRPFRTNRVFHLPVIRLPRWRLFQEIA